MKGNVRASARNIKLSHKGAIVAPELPNFTGIHQPLSFTHQPGALQHPWVWRAREKEKPRDCALSDPGPACHGWRLGNCLLCLARSRAPVQCSLGSRRLRGILCPWKPGQASRKAGAELPKPPRATLELQETGHSSSLGRPFYSSSEPPELLLPCWGENGAQTALPILP